MVNIQENIIQRKSIVTFSNKEVEQDKLDSLFEAARWAPSSMNQQPWRFIAVKGTDKKQHRKVISCLAEGNISWAKYAPVFIIGIAEKISSYKNRMNKYAEHDLGLATANLYTQATYLGLRLHIMGGFDPKKTKELFNIPERFEPMTVIALGHEGNASDFSAEIQVRANRDRTRNEINEFVFEGSWPTFI